jgi:hypothetical protein
MIGLVCDKRFNIVVAKITPKCKSPNVNEEFRMENGE